MKFNVLNAQTLGCIILNFYTHDPTLHSHFCLTIYPLQTFIGTLHTCAFYPCNCTQISKLVSASTIHDKYLNENYV